MLRKVLLFSFMLSAIIVGLMLIEYYAVRQGMALRFPIIEVASLIFLAIVVAVFTYTEMKRESPFLFVRALVAPLGITLTVALLVGLVSYFYVATINLNYSDFMAGRRMSQLPAHAPADDSIGTYLSAQMYYSPLGQFLAKFFSLSIVGGLATMAVVIFTGLKRNRLTSGSS